MRTLTYPENPVQQAYNGGDQFNIRQLQQFCSTTSANFTTLEAEVSTMKMSMADMKHKINACYDFINWVQKHSPETTAAYKAHNQVLHAFDKAEQGEFMYPQAEASA